MHTPADQGNIEDKINRFMARKSASLWGSISKTVTGHLTPRSRHTTDSDISYEPLDWNRSESVVSHSGLQKAH